MTLPDAPPGLSDLAKTHVPPPDLRRMAESIGPLHGWGLDQGKKLAQMDQEQLAALSNEALDTLEQHGHLTGPERKELGRVSGLDHTAASEHTLRTIHEVHSGMGADASPAAIILAAVANDSAQAHRHHPTLMRVVAYDFAGAAIGGAVGGLFGALPGCILGAAVGALGASAYAEATGP